MGNLKKENSHTNQVVLWKRKNDYWILLSLTSNTFQAVMCLFSGCYTYKSSVQIVYGSIMYNTRSKTTYRHSDSVHSGFYCKIICTLQESSLNTIELGYFNTSVTLRYLLFKVSANPKLTVLHNFRFLYDSINIRNSFGLRWLNSQGNR